MVLIAVFIGVVYVLNASWLRSSLQGGVKLLAHRGVHHTYSAEGIGKFDCTAKIIDSIGHEYFENTIESIEQAFAYGADTVELDIRRTADDQFAVFHDGDLDCRTNGKGPVHESTLAEVKALDIGYGYTSDNGQSFPLRGKGFNKVPSLKDVVKRFPNKNLLINLKSGATKEAILLTYYLKSLSQDQRDHLIVYGSTNSVSKVLAAIPNLKGYTRDSVKQCVLNYELIAWTSYVPEACRNTVLQVPINYGVYLWGWPKTFMHRMNSVGTTVFLTGHYNGSTSGVDSKRQLTKLSESFNGYIWTNKIEVIGSKVP